MLCAMSGTRFAALLAPILGDVSHSAPANDVRPAAPCAPTLWADSGRNGRLFSNAPAVIEELRTKLSEHVEVPG